MPIRFNGGADQDIDEATIQGIYARRSAAVAGVKTSTSALSISSLLELASLEGFYNYFPHVRNFEIENCPNLSLKKILDFVAIAKPNMTCRILFQLRDIEGDERQIIFINSPEQGAELLILDEFGMYQDETLGGYNILPLDTTRPDLGMADRIRICLNEAGLVTNQKTKPAVSLSTKLGHVLAVTARNTISFVSHPSVWGTAAVLVVSALSGKAIATLKKHNPIRSEEIAAVAVKPTPSITRQVVAAKLTPVAVRTFESHAVLVSIDPLATPAPLPKPPEVKSTPAPEQKVIEAVPAQEKVEPPPAPLEAETAKTENPPSHVTTYEARRSRLLRGLAGEAEPTATPTAMNRVR